MIAWRERLRRYSGGRNEHARRRAFRPSLTPLEERLALRLDPTLPVTVQPVQRTDAYFVNRHLQNLDRIRTHRDNVLFFGDSTVDLWPLVGYGSWDAKIKPFGAADFGISSDRTENIIWQMQNGELAGRPKVVVVEVGLNDFFRGLDPESLVDEIAAGIETIIRTVQDLSPRTKIIVMGVIPRGVEPDDPQRVAIRHINDRVAKYAGGHGVTFLDISSIFLEPDGTRPVTRFGVHPDSEQYDAWADALRGPLKRLLSPPKTTRRDGPTKTPGGKTSKPPTVVGDPTQGSDGKDSDPPTVIGVRTTVSDGKITQFVVQFDEPMHAYSARNPANYTLSQVLPDASQKSGRSLHQEPLKSVTYDSKTRTAILIPSFPLDVPFLYQLSVNGTSPSGVRDEAGNFLDGLRNGQAGSSYVKMIVV